MTYITNMIKKKYPDYDTERYRYKFGDIVRTKTHALIFVEYSAIVCVRAYVLKSGFGLKQGCEVDVAYSELPYFKKGQFVNKKLPISKSLNWKIGDVVMDPTTGCTLLLKRKEGKGFIALILNSDNEFYKETSVYIENPYRDSVV